MRQYGDTMKRDFKTIKNDEADSMLGMQDEDVRKLFASREHLLALNAIFDAALTGEPARHIAKDIDVTTPDVAHRFLQHLRNEESTTEH